MRTKEEWEKLSKDIKEEDFNLRLEDPLRRMRSGAPLSESDSEILVECFDALVKKVAMLKTLNTLDENEINDKVGAKNTLALTDKIIEVLEKRAYEQFNEFARGQLLSAIEEIRELEKEAEFEEIAKVMMKHLGNGEKYHPHHTVIITNSTAELVEGKKSVGQIMD